MKIKDIMTSRSLRYCSTEMTLPEAAKLMQEANIGAIPVVDFQKKVLGIVTDRDICLWLAHEQKYPVESTTVGQIMRQTVYMVYMDDELSAAFRQMRRNRISRLPVIDKKGILRGIVSLHGLIDKYLNKGLEQLGNENQGENLLRTVQAITRRYTHKSGKEMKEKQEKTPFGSGGKIAYSEYEELPGKH